MSSKSSKDVTTSGAETRDPESSEVWPDSSYSVVTNGDISSLELALTHIKNRLDRQDEQLRRIETEFPECRRGVETLLADVTNRVQNLEDVTLGNLSRQMNSSFDSMKKDVSRRHEEQKRLLLNEFFTADANFSKTVRFALMFILVCLIGHSIVNNLRLSEANLHMPILDASNDSLSSRSYVNLQDLSNIIREQLQDGLAKTSGDISIILAQHVSSMKTEFKSFVAKSQDMSKSEMAKVGSRVITEMSAKLESKMKESNTKLRKDAETSLDQQLQHLNRDIADLIEKEAQLARESSQIPNSPQRKVFKFHFLLRNFQERVGSGLELFSPPWYIPQFETSIKGFVRFVADGNLYVRLVYGRYPNLVGLQPKPSKSFSAKIMVIDEENSEKTRQLHHFSASLNEQKVMSNSWGWSVGTFSCEEFLQAGYVKFNSLVIKYVVTVY